MYLGHGGKPCPKNHSPAVDINMDIFLGDLKLEWEDEEEDMAAASEGEDPDQDFLEDDLVIVHTTGVFKHQVRWCTCLGCPEKHIQLLRMNLFSSSIIRPSTVFTFDVLDHFSADASECKTVGQSFYNKLHRLTNNAFPHMVPVRTHSLVSSRVCSLTIETTESIQRTVTDITTVARLGNQKTFWFWA